MQFTRLFNKIRIYALVFIFLNSLFNISSKNLSGDDKQIISPKNLSEKPKEEKKIRKDTSITTAFLKPAEKDLKNKDFSFTEKSQIKISTSIKKENGFDKYSAIKLLLDIGKFTIKNYSAHKILVLYTKCIVSIKDSIDEFEPLLKNFWNEMLKLSKDENALELKNRDSIGNIYKKLFEKNVKVEESKTEKCKSALQMQNKINKKKGLENCEKR